MTEIDPDETADEDDLTPELAYLVRGLNNIRSSNLPYEATLLTSDSTRARRVAFDHYAPIIDTPVRRFSGAVHGAGRAGCTPVRSAGAGLGHRCAT